MSGFILCKEKDGGHTLVPDFFVDNYMPEADGEYVKIYLYLLRCLKSRHTGALCLSHRRQSSTTPRIISAGPSATGRR